MDSDDCIHYGEHVWLSCHLDHTGDRVAIMHSGGFSDTAVQAMIAVVQPDAGPRVPGSFVNCVFQIQPAQASMGQDGSHDGVGHASGLVARRPVKFGDTILLRHVRSGKLVAGVPSRLISSQAGTLVARLLNSMEKSCMLVIQSRYKYRSDGSRVTVGDDITLVSLTERRYLSAETASASDATMPVRASLATAGKPLILTQVSLSAAVWPWTICRFNDGMPAASLRSGDILRLFHFESTGFASCVASSASVLLQATRCYGSSGSSGSGSSSSESPTERVDTNSYWELEALRQCSGESLSSNHPLRLRHVNSGRFLQLRVQQADANPYITLTPDTSDDTVFMLAHIGQAASGSLSAGDTVQIQHVASKLWLHGTRALMSTTVVSTSSAALPLAQQASGRMKVLEYQLSCSVAATGQDVFRLVAADAQDLRQTMVLLGLVPALEQYILAFRTAAQTSVAPRFLNAEALPVDAKVLRAAEYALDELHGFLVGDDDAPAFADVAELSLGHTPLPIRQQRVAEHAVTELLLGMLTAPFDVWQGPLPLSEHMPTAVREVCQLVYQLLALVFADNPANEAVAARHIDVVLKQIGFDLGAEKALTTLLSSNLALIEQLPPQHVEEFFAMLRAKGRSPAYLRFLAALCAFQGQGVPGKQELVCDLLFDADFTFVFPVRSCDAALQVQLDPKSEWLDLIDFYDAHAGARTYFTAQLALFAAMCIGRNYVSIGKISPMFSRDALEAAVWQDMLPFRARAALCELYSVLYVDVNLHEELVVAPRTRLWGDIATNSSALGRCAALRPQDVPAWADAFVHKLTGFFQQCKIGEHSAAEATFALALLHLARQLLSFGLVSVVPRAGPSAFHLLCHSLLHMLDGRAPAMGQEHLLTLSDGTAGASASLGVSSRPGSIAPRPGRSAFASPVADRPRGASVSSVGSPYVADPDHPPSGTPPAPTPPGKAFTSMRAFRSTRMNLKIQARIRRFNEDDDAEVEDVGAEQARLFLECRQCICGIFSFVAKLRADFVIAELLSVFHGNLAAIASDEQLHVLRTAGWPVPRTSHMGASDSSHVLAAAWQVQLSTKWDLQHICGDSLGDVLLDLLKFDHDGLTAAALEVLLDFFGGAVTVQRMLRDVQLLVSPSTVAAYSLSVAVLPVLQHHVELSETWMDAEAADDLVASRCVRGILERLADLMWLAQPAAATPDGIVSILSTPTLPAHFSVDPERQRVMRNLSVSELVIKLLQQGSAMYSNRLQTGHTMDDRFKRELLHTFAHCYRFLVMFTAHNEAHQQQLVPHVDLFVTLVSQGLLPATVLAMLMRDSDSLARHVKPSFVQRLVDMVVDFGHVPSLLDPLIALLASANAADVDVLASGILKALSDRQDTAVALLHHDLPALRDACSATESVTALMAQTVADADSYAVYQPCRSPTGCWSADWQALLRVSSNSGRSITGPASPDTLFERFSHQLCSDELLYYAKLLQLFGKLAAVSGLSTVEALRVAFPFKQTVEVMQTDWMPMPVKQQLLHIVDALWLHTRTSPVDGEPMNPVQLDSLHASPFLTWLGDAIMAGARASSALAAPPGGSRGGSFLQLSTMVGHLALLETLLPAASHVITLVMDRRVTVVAVAVVQAAHEKLCGRAAAAHTTPAQALKVVDAAMVAAQVLRAPWWGPSAAEASRIQEMLAELQTVRRPSGAAVGTPAGPETATKSNNEVPGGVVVETDDETLGYRGEDSPRKSRSIQLIADTVQAVFQTFVAAMAEQASPQASAASHELVCLAGMEPDAQFVDFVSSLVRGGKRINRDMSFQTRLRRCIQFARSAGQHRGGSLQIDAIDLILRTIRILIATANNPADQSRLQTLLVEQDAIALLDELLRVPQSAQQFDALIATCISMLEGGNPTIQSVLTGLWSKNNAPLQHMHSVLSDSTAIIKECQQLGMAASERGLKLESSSADDDSRLQLPPTLLLVLQLLQAMCEGHHDANQNLLREQPGAKVSVNLVAATVAVLAQLQQVLTPALLPVAIQALDTLIEMVQGPCGRNQLELIDRRIVEVAAGLLTTLELMFSQEETRANAGRVKVLQHRCSLIMTSLFEGRTDAVVHARVATILTDRDTADAMKHTLVRVYSDFVELHGTVYTEAAFMQQFVKGASAPRSMSDEQLASRAVLDTGFGIYILFRHLLDFDPALRPLIHMPPSDDPSAMLASSIREGSGLAQMVMNLKFNTMALNLLGGGGDAKAGPKLYAAALDFFAQHTKSVEMLRDGELEKFYFPEPPMCAHLTQRTREEVTWRIDRSSPAKKIQSLFELHSEFVAEMRYQGWLQHQFLSVVPLMQAMFMKVLQTRWVPNFFTRLVAWFMKRVMTRLFDLYASVLIEGYTGTSVGTGMLTHPGKGGWQTVCLLLTASINFLVLGCYERDVVYTSFTASRRTGVCDQRIFGYETHVHWPTVLMVLGFLQLVLGGCIAVYNLLNFAPLIVLKAHKRITEEAAAEAAKHADTSGPIGGTATAAVLAAQDPLTWTSIGDGMVVVPRKRRSMRARCQGLAVWARVIYASCVALASSPLMFWGFFSMFSVLGMSVHPYFYALCLLELISRFEELRLVLRAVMRPAKHLSLTGLLFVVIEYYFSIIGFVFFNENYHDCNKFGEFCTDQCVSLFSCFITTFDQGFKNNGGVGAYLGANLYLPGTVTSFQWMGRFIFDNLYNIILLTIMMNVVFGLILDTFAELRTQRKEKEDDIKGVCFICSMNRTEFDRRGRGFRVHLEEEHNVWNYVYLIVHVLYKPHTELTGVEEYLFRLIREGNTSFFPLERSLVLQGGVRRGDDQSQ